MIAKTIQTVLFALLCAATGSTVAQGLDAGSIFSRVDDQAKRVTAAYAAIHDPEREEAARIAREKAEREARAREKPILPIISEIISGMVQIPGKGYKMGKTEVTQAQWEAVMGNNPSKFKGANNPVENVSWVDCQEFLKKLNALPSVRESGLVFRLPAEQEWEYACRAGSTGDYCKLADGTEITESTLREVAWYDDNSKRTTHPVGQKKPNAFGLYDMHGNVWEWCEDLYQAGNSSRVRRGGSWSNLSGLCAAGNRVSYGPDSRFNRLGFRLAASQDVNR